MNHSLRYSTLVLALLAVCAFDVQAATITKTDTLPTTDHASFYGNSAEGWYWYNDPEKPEMLESPLPPAVLPPPAKEIKEVQPEEPKSFAPTSPSPFSAAWVRAMLPKYKDLAWDNPTPENVQAYFLLQRFAIDRSSKFADVAKTVTLGNPLLDETFRRPLASFATMTVDKHAGVEREALLKKVAKKAGLFFFFKSDCSYCEAQAPLLGYLIKELDFEVLAISMDGKQPQTYTFPHLRKDVGQAASLGLTSVPALYLVTPEGVFEQLGQGVVSLPELKQRILIAAMRRGWISEEEFNETKPLMNPNKQRDLSKELPKLLKASAENPALLFGSQEGSEQVASLSKEKTETLVDQDGFIAPEKLIGLFGAGASTSGSLNADFFSHASESQSKEKDAQNASF